MFVLHYKEDKIGGILMNAFFFLLKMVVILKKNKEVVGIIRKGGIYA